MLRLFIFQKLRSVVRILIILKANLSTMRLLDALRWEELSPLAVRTINLVRGIALQL